MSLRLSRIFHAGYVLEYENTRILFDPIFETPFSRNCFSYPPVQINIPLLKAQSWDAVFISHYHDDHFSLESLNHLSRSTPIYIYCIHEEAISLLRNLGFHHIYNLELGLRVDIHNLSIIPTRALDADVDCIFQILAGDLKILNIVDSWIDDNTLQALSQKAPWDVVLWPFQTMQELEVLCPSRAQWSDGEPPIEWKESLLKLRAHVVIPSACQFIHEDWSWYRSTFFPVTYKKFNDTLINWSIPSTVMRLEPGQSLNLKSNSISASQPLSWLDCPSDSLVDYSYNPTSNIPHTQDLALRFPPLTKREKNIVDHFCQTEILKRWARLNTEKPTPTHWKLSVYGHNDETKIFYFLIEKNQMRITNEISEDLLDWNTEIPISRLWGAIANGETLSSLYIRINDQKFSPQVEEKLASAELTDDPLLRCLYDGFFAGYQKKQLSKILSDSSI